MRNKKIALFAVIFSVFVGLMPGKVYAEDNLLIEDNIPVLRDSFTDNLGEDTYAGVSLTGDEISNPNIMALVTKHFNAVTLGNELKPDAMFGYSNHTCPGIMTYDLNGQEFDAPKLDYSRAEKMLDYIAKWNNDNPDRQIKVRGHVLVWHSQTPEWFFHKNYDKSEDYVTPAEMDLRQEWYIKEVLTHFTQRYPDMFYGWDVVNEAISDATGTYRTDTENGGKLSDDTHGSKSSWWKVYGSNKYIINAFKYANKYAPDYVELYYNDYNECTPLKSNGIIQLLEDVKAAEGTRIGGMGMQGHYDMSTPTGGQVKVAARRYAEVVGNVALTELDLKANTSYDGSDEEKAKEYRRQYYKYKEIYQGLKELREEGVTVRTVTVWGVIDGHSWLQSQNNVGGGTNGKQKQCPLLFDDDYKAKPLFYALCNEEMPIVKEKTSEEIEENSDAAEDEGKNDIEKEADEIKETDDSAAETTDSSNIISENNSSPSEEKSSEEVKSYGGMIAAAVAILLIAAGGFVINKKRKK